MTILPVALNINKGDFFPQFTLFIAVIQLTIQFCNAFMKLLLQYLHNSTVDCKMVQMFEQKNIYPTKPEQFGVVSLPFGTILLSTGNVGGDWFGSKSSQWRSILQKSHHLCKSFVKFYFHPYVFIHTKQSKHLLHIKALAKILDLNVSLLVLQFMCGL